MKDGAWKQKEMKYGSITSIEYRKNSSYKVMKNIKYKCMKIKPSTRMTNRSGGEGGTFGKYLIMLGFL